MRVALTGTPGTGKTTASERLDCRVLHLNDVVREEGLSTGRDVDRDSLVVDLDALSAWVDEQADDGDEVVVLDSHLAHHLDVDRVVVLRCRPDLLESRLRDRGENEAKARENRESEALDVVLSEAVAEHGEESVYEIDTTGRDPESVAAEIRGVVAGDREPSAGTVDFIEYLPTTHR